MQEIFMRLVRIDYLIRIKGTGSPSQLANRLGVGERTIYEYISTMKSLGAPIRFCRHRRSYYYDKEGAFTISFINNN
jgi:predicted DNA-binding transcriptional regulator YafY